MKNKKNKIILSSVLGSFGLVSTIGIATVCSSCSSEMSRGPLNTIWVDMDNDGNDDYLITEYTDGTYVFNKMINKNIKTFEFPNLNFTAIYSNAFAVCRELTSIIIPNSVELIMSDAFIGCNNLSSIILPNKLTKILNSVFDDCLSLKNISLPSSLTYIGENAFSSLNYGVYTPLPQLIINVPNNTIKQLVIDSGFTDENRIIVENSN